MTSTFDQVVLPSRLDKNVYRTYSTCDVYGCKKKATAQVTVNAGYLGDVILNLCKICVPKFSDNKVSKNGLLHRSLPLNGKEGVYHHEYKS
jgi:hypothetical protein